MEERCVPGGLTPGGSGPVATEWRQPTPPKATAFVAELSGANLPLPIPTRAHGSVSFRLNHDGSKLDVQGFLSTISNVTVVDLHMRMGLGPALSDPTVAILIQPPPGMSGGPVGHAVFRTVIKAPYLTGPLLKHRLSDLVDAMRQGRIYVLVQTNSMGIDSSQQPGNYSPSVVLPFNQAFTATPIQGELLGTVVPAHGR